MASIYTRKKSPYFWLRYRSAAGEWRDRSTGIRIDNPTGKRQATRQAQLESADETDLRASAVGHAFKEWVPAFLHHRYGKRQPTAYERYGQCWSALSIYLEDGGIVTAGQVTSVVSHKRLDLFS